MSATQLRVWIGCLACYNEGRLCGEWYDADEAGEVTVEQIHATWNEPLPKYVATHEELWCLDTDGFGTLLTGECSPCEAQRIAELVADIDDDDRDALSAYMADRGESLDDQLIDRFRDAYQGRADSERDYAMDYAEETDAVPANAGWPLLCIDWDRAARDLFMDGIYSLDASGGGIHVFSDH